MKKLKTAIVGFGFMGKTHALNVFRSGRMELSAIVDADLNRIYQPGGNFDTGGIDTEILAALPKYMTLEECLEKETIDLVFICVHTKLHYEMAKLSLERGAHVFVEKPFVLDIAEGEALVEEAKRRKRLLGVGHVVRFMPAYRKLREIYRSNTYGALKFISLSRFSGVPDWGDWGKRQREFGSSGGALFDLVIHDIDFLHFLLGQPEKVESTFFGGALSPQDYLSAFWRYADRELQVKVEGGNTFHSKFPFEAGFKATFERASLVWHSYDGTEIKVADHQETHSLPVENVNEGFREESEYFARCIQEGRYPEACSGESALETIRLCYRHVEQVND